MTDEIETIWVSDIVKKCVAIVRFGPSGLETDGIKTGEYFQVTIDPKRFSPSKKFIRFGEYPGDELIGWQRAKIIAVVDILGDWKDETPPIMNWTTSPAID